MKKYCLFTLICITFSLQAGPLCATGLPATTPTKRFSLGTSTVTDRETGLTWMTCSLGQTWSKDGCLGEAESYSWSEALNKVANEYSGWRVPNIKELSSIVELRCAFPAINFKAFPNTPRAVYWSSSPSATRYSHQWGVNFDEGDVISGSHHFNHGGKIRLVRGGL